MKILLTGATGFIGKNLREFWSGRYDLYVPGRLELDLLKADDVHEYLKRHSFDIIIHTANTNDFKYNLANYDILDQNLRMFFNLENNSTYYDRMYYFGSGAEYDRQHYKPRLKETDFGKYLPTDAYGFSKYTMTKVIENRNNIYNLRLFGVYGKYEQWQRRFISNALCRSIKKMPITISQNVRFDYLYIYDLCQIMEWFLFHRPRYHCYNVCTGVSTELTSIAEMINDVTGLQRDIIVKTPGYKSEYSGDNTRLMEEIGRFEFTEMKIAVKYMYQHYLRIQESIDETQLL